MHDTQGPTLSTSTSSFEALDPHDPQVDADRVKNVLRVYSNSPCRQNLGYQRI